MSMLLSNKQNDIFYKLKVTYLKSVSRNHEIFVIKKNLKYH